MCVVLQNVPFSRPTPSWQGRPLPLSRCIPLGCARLQILRGKIFRQAAIVVHHRHRACMHHGTCDRSITIRGERSCSTQPPHDRGKILSPSGHPSPIPLRPTLCSLDTHQGSLRAPCGTTRDQGAYSLPLCNRPPIVPARLRAKVRPWQSHFHAFRIWMIMEVFLEEISVCEIGYNRA